MDRCNSRSQESNRSSEARTPLLFAQQIIGGEADGMCQAGLGGAGGVVVSRALFPLFRLFPLDVDEKLAMIDGEATSVFSSWGMFIGVCSCWRIILYN